MNEMVMLMIKSRLTLTQYIYTHTHTHHDKLTRDEPFKHDQVLSQQKAEFTDKPSFQKKKKKKGLL